MKALFTSVAVLFACFAMAEEGDDALRKALAESEAVLVGKVASEPKIDTSEEGIASYRFDLSVSETLEGDVTDKYLKVTIAHAESNADERLTWLKKKSQVVVFLRNRGDEKHPDWVGVDVSPNIRPYGERLVSSLKRLKAEPPTKLPLMEGLVLGEKDGLAQISLGADDGVKAGHVFFWYRGDVPMGQLVVTKTLPISPAQNIRRTKRGTPHHRSGTIELSRGRNSGPYGGHIRRATIVAKPEHDMTRAALT